MEKHISGVIKKPGEKAYFSSTIGNDLKSLQGLVGGYIETFTFARDATVICNEEGRINGMPYNCNFLGLDLYGPVLVVGVDGEEFSGLSDRWAEMVMRELNS